MRFTRLTFKQVSVAVFVATSLLTLTLMFCFQYCRSPARMSSYDNHLGVRDLGIDLYTGDRNTSKKITLEWKNRILHLQKVCKGRKQNLSEKLHQHPQLLSHIIVNDQYKMLYCYIPKVACTNLKRIFLVLTGKMNTTNILDIKSKDVHFQYNKYLTYLHNLSHEDAIFRLKNYQKIIYVREPFERILSAFVNKFEGKNDYFKLRYGKKIIKRYRDEPDSRDLDVRDVKFSEFVQFLSDPAMQIKGFNEHWAQFHSLCQPCYVKYNFIGKYETLESDVNHLLSTMNISSRIEFPKRSASYKKLRTVDKLSQYYKAVPENILHDLWETYKFDYKLFGYPYPPIL